MTTHTNPIPADVAAATLSVYAAKEGLDLRVDALGDDVVTDGATLLALVERLIDKAGARPANPYPAADLRR